MVGHMKTPHQIKIEGRCKKNAEEEVKGETKVSWSAIGKNENTLEGGKVLHESREEELERGMHPVCIVVGIIRNNNVRVREELVASCTPPRNTGDKYLTRG